MYSDQTSHKQLEKPLQRRGSRWIIQPRDISTFVEIYHNPMARDQALRLCPFGSITRLNTRFNRYVADGYVVRHNLPFFGQSVYTLGEAACPLVAAEMGLDTDTVRRQVRIGESPQFLQHALRIVDVKISIQKGCRTAAISSIWRTERQARHQYRVRIGGAWNDHVLKPDAYVRIGDAGSAEHCFVEVDLGHRSLPMIGKSMAGYVRYATSVFQETYGAKRFVVLCIAPGRLRIDHMRDVARQTGASMFRFATFDGLFADGPFGAIWLSPDGSDKVAVIDPGRGAGVIRSGVLP